MAKKKAIVIGRNYGNILATARALGKAGYEVNVIKIFEKKPKWSSFLRSMRPDKYSRYVKEYTECLVGNRGEKLLEVLLGMAEKEKQVLFSVDDYAVYLVDTYKKELLNDYSIASIRDNDKSIAELMNKEEQKKLACEIHMPVLKSVLLQAENGNFEIPKEVAYPCFVKPYMSIPGTKNLMRKCATRQELDKSLEQFLKKGAFKVLVEDYIEIKEEYSILGIRTNEVVCAPCVFKAKARGHKGRKGVAITGETVDSKRFLPFIETCCNYVKALEYNGIFDIDLAEDTDGNLYFFEINFRAGASIHVFTQSGINLLAILADHLLEGTKIDTARLSAKSGVTFVSEKVLLEEYVSGDVRRSKMKAYLNHADVCFIKDKEDPKPYSYFKRYYIIAFAMRVLYKIRSKIRK